ncbi:MAG: hypothetical protein CSA81_02205 [Acidobacteria bacterium]|nr:MAG: hypothetical protein CSA81_02205 [Acidobacteriota bacterium]
MDGTGKEVVTTTGISNIEVLIADYKRDKLFFTDWGMLIRCNLDGSDPHAVFSDHPMITDAKLDFSRNQLYVLAQKPTNSEVFSVVYQIDASATHLTASELDPVITLPYGSTSFATNFSNDCIYFQSYLGNTTQETIITKTRMDGSNPETILVISQPYSKNLELSYSQQRLYWCSGGDICMLDLEVGASSFQSVYVTQGNVHDLVVDNFHNRLYWTGNIPPSIQRSDLSVQNIETVLTQPVIIGGGLYNHWGPLKLDVVLKQPFSSVPTMSKYGLFIFASLFILLALALKKRKGTGHS